MLNNIDDFIHMSFEENNIAPICRDCIEEAKKIYQAKNLTPEVGDLVKVDFKPSTDPKYPGECIWIRLTKRDQPKGPWFGELDNNPGDTLPPSYKCGDEVSFNPKDIMSLVVKDTDRTAAHKQIFQELREQQKYHEKHEKKTAP